MCGISGIIQPNQPIEVVLQKAEKMISALSHRGPDEENLWFDQTLGLALGHRRLAIQDLSPRGSQPMTSQSENLIIIYNGEIYNFKSLACELKSSGVQFRGDSDTEVLLAAIEQWGLDQTLTRIKGMFAFALWNKRNKTLHLVRDRIGEKPLYFGFVDGQFVFSSELKSFFAIADKSKFQLDFDALGSYLRYGYISAPYSIFKNLRKLSPGHSISIAFDADRTPQNFVLQEVSEIVQSCYWALDTIRTQQRQNLVEDEQVAIEQLDSLLNQVIREQSIADVPLGTFLSGGIDSSVVSSILQANSTSPIDTFTIGFHEKNFNEAEHAKKISAHIGSCHHELYISPKDALETIPSLSAIYDEPFADSSQIPTLLVSRQAKEKVTVCLSGDGGDELFAGYNRYFATQRANDMSQYLPRPARKIIASALTTVKPAQWDKAHHLLTTLFSSATSANVGLKIHKLAQLITLDSLEEIYRYLSGYWQDPSNLLTSSIHEPDLKTPLAFDSNFLDAAMQWDQQWYLPGDNLVKSDRASMAVSLEMRLPLLDKEIIEYSWRVPNRMKVRNNQGKWLLRQVLYRYVPASLIDRPKMGFSVPIARWIRHELKDWAADLLCESTINQQGIFNYAAVNQAYNQHMSGRYDHSHKLWTLLMFQDWYQNFLKH